MSRQRGRSMKPNPNNLISPFCCTLTEPTSTSKSGDLVKLSFWGIEY